MINTKNNCEQGNNSTLQATSSHETATPTSFNVTNAQYDHQLPYSQLNSVANSEALSEKLKGLFSTVFEDEPINFILTTEGNEVRLTMMSNDIIATLTMHAFNRSTKVRRNYPVKPIRKGGQQ